MRAALRRRRAPLPCCTAPTPINRLASSLQAEGLLSEDCGDRRTVLAVVTLLLLAPLVSAT